MRLMPSRRKRRKRTPAIGRRYRCSETGSMALLLALVLATPAVAMSIFDTIQLSERGYSDKAIIELFEATDSAFALEAADLSRLKKLGVSEAVIRAMLERTVVPADRETEGQSAQVDTLRQDDQVSDERLDNPFAVHPIHEKRGGGHVHLSLALDGLELLVLRDENSHASIEARGTAIVESLGSAWAESRGDFQLRRTESNTEIVFLNELDREGAKPIRIMSVSAGDARGYELRSGRSVKRDLLAHYWVDLFNDFRTVARGDQPKRLLAIHEGEALALLAEALSELDPPERSLRSAAEGVPSAARHHLQRLARTVPMDYGETGGH